MRNVFSLMVCSMSLYASFRNDIISMNKEVEKEVSEADLVVPEFGPWQISPSYAPPEGESPHQIRFAPEKGEEISWSGRNLPDALVTPFEMEENTVLYLKRTVFAPRAGICAISLGSDDAVKIFLDGKQIWELKVGRACKPDQNRLRLKLAAGKQTLMIKLTNYKYGGGLYFNPISSLQEERECEYNSRLHAFKKKLTNKQKRALEKEIREGIWDYQTVVPGKDGVLRAFADAAERLITSHDFAPSDELRKQATSLTSLTSLDQAMGQFNSCKETYIRELIRDENRRILENRRGTLTIHAEPGTEIAVNQIRHDFPFGCALNYKGFNQSLTSDEARKYKQIFLQNFNYAVHENALKWYHTNRNGPAPSDWQDADIMLKWCTENNIPMRGHCLFWEVEKWVLS